MLLTNRNLYLLTTIGLGDFYVLAKDPAEAQNSLEKKLNDQKYGMSDDRRVINIKWLAEEFNISSVSQTKRLLVVEKNDVS